MRQFLKFRSSFKSILYFSFSKEIKKIIEIVSQIIFYKFNLNDGAIQSKMKSCINYVIETLNFYNSLEDLDRGKVLRILIWMLKLLSNLVYKLQDNLILNQDKLLLKNYIVSFEPNEVY